MECAYSTTAAANSPAATSPTTATASLGWTSTVGIAIAFTTACSALAVCFRLSCKLDRNFPIENSLTVEFGDGTFSLGRS